MAKDSGRQFSTTSMADIAFLLLVFFLVATTMDIDTSLYRTQSSPSNQPPLELKKQNVVAQMNSNDRLMDKDNEIPLSMLQQRTKESHINSQNKENQPEKRIESVEPVGKIEISHFKATSLYSINYPCIVSLHL